MTCETCDSCPTFNPKGDLTIQFDEQRDRVNRSLLYYKMNSCDNLLYKLLYRMNCTDNELIDTVKELKASGGGSGGGNPPDYDAVKQRITNLETTVSTYGTAATKDFGISAGSVPVIGSNGKLDPTILPPSTGSSIETSTYTAVAQGGNDFIINYDSNKTISAPKANTSLYYIKEGTSIQLLAAVSDFSLSGQISVNADGTAMGTVSNSKLTFLSGQTQATAVSISVIGDHCYINVLTDAISTGNDTDIATINATDAPTAKVHYMRQNGIVYVTAAGNWGTFEKGKGLAKATLPAGFRPPISWGAGIGPMGGNSGLTASIGTDGVLTISSSETGTEYGEFSMSYPAVN